MSDERPRYDPVKPGISVRRSSLPDYPWVADCRFDSNPFHRSWNFFETREKARAFARDTKRAWAAWRAELAKTEELLGPWIPVNAPKETP